jgi:energy-coupling factor transporter ATP-binding protein EcfA2
MQIERLVLYSHSGDTRVLEFRPGALNVITGESGTGKSALINILRYCLGSGALGVPVGPISRSVAWYALVVAIGPTRLLLGRPTPDAASETSAALVLVEPSDLPRFSDLVPNTTRWDMREYLAGLLGIEENLHVPNIGQTRAPLAAGFVHTLYYCFQAQGEVANPSILFHRQNEDWQTQTIRDTLPYFLGVQGLQDLLQRRRLAQERRALRAIEQQLERARSLTIQELDRAAGLLAEARDAGLVEIEIAADLDARGRRQVLAGLINTPPQPSTSVDIGGQFELARTELAERRDRAREIVDELQGLESFSEVVSGVWTELGEQRGRLISIGLVPVEGVDVDCPVCGTRLTAESDGDHAAVTTELERVSRRLGLAARDRPRIERARSQLLEERNAIKARIEELQRNIDALVDTNELIARERQRINVQSYVRGKIAEYLSGVVELDDSELDQLERNAEQLRTSVAGLEELLDPSALRSRVESAIALISREITEIAGSLGLEHSSLSVRLDPHRLTVVADTQDGPAHMDAGEIGSGFNWVGYHLAVYLALHRYFIHHDRPVPRFVVIDQPSQAFFPPDHPSSDLDALDDTDRAQTLELYSLMYREVDRQAGALQLIVLDHADFDEAWFQDSVVERWRGGHALIPRSWFDDTDVEDLEEQHSDDPGDVES